MKILTKRKQRMLMAVLCNLTAGYAFDDDKLVADNICVLVSTICGDKGLDCLQSYLKTVTDNMKDDDNGVQTISSSD